MSGTRVLLRSVVVAAYVAAVFVVPFVLPQDAPGWVRTTVAVVMVAVPVLLLVGVVVRTVRLVRRGTRDDAGR